MSLKEIVLFHHAPEAMPSSENPTWEQQWNTKAILGKSTHIPGSLSISLSVQGASQEKLIFSSWVCAIVLW